MPNDASLVAPTAQRGLTLTLSAGCGGCATGVSPLCRRGRSGVDGAEQGPEGELPSGTGRLPAPPLIDRSRCCGSSSPKRGRASAVEVPWAMVEGAGRTVC